MKQFDLWKTTLTDISHVGEPLLKKLDNAKTFSQVNNPNKHIDACVGLRSMYEDGAISPVIAWVDETQQDFYFHPGKTRMEMWRAFPDLLEMPLYIIDPYRTHETRLLIQKSFLTAHLTNDTIDFKLKPHKGHHRLFPLVNNLTNKEIDIKYFFGDGKYGHMRHEYELAIETQDKRLEIYFENKLLYSLGDQEEPVQYVVDKPWKAWYPFVEYTGVFDDID